MDALARSPALPWLYGTRVQRVDGPFPGLFVLTLFDRGEKQFLLLACTPQTRGVGALPERPKGAAASAFVQRLRTHIEGARLVGAQWWSPPHAPTDRAHALMLEVERGGEHRARIVADFDAKQPALYLLRPDGSTAGASDERARRARFPVRDQPYVPPSGRGVARIESADALRPAGDALLTTKDRRTADDARSRAQAVVRAQLKRVERKLEAIRGDLARAESAPRLRREGQLLLCHLAQIPRGAAAAKLRDDATDPPEWVELQLDPARDAQQNAQLRFERARKLERGIAIASSRLAETQAHAERLRELLARVAHDPPEAIGAQAAALGLELALQPAPTRGPKPPQRIAYRVFTSGDGHKILVGKGAADNDTLTLTVARPHDHWLHARGSAGAHVVVPLDRKATIGQELLLDAAHLAAHFSKLRGEPTIEIAHTERRFVRKPKGAAPGSVNVDRERVFVLRVERERLARLLASERT